MKLIDKVAVVAEIERRITLLENNSDGIISTLASGMFVNEYKDLLSFLATLEVKEVSLENELKEDWLFADKTEVDCLECMCLTDDMFVSLAKKYFELGLQEAKG